ncbi:MAG: DUF4405 domain-containing protein [Eggerthellaceae bacterium]|nr:DUF4405 domain-containing protein [Eggerthellaceae bacterium]
MATAKTQAKAQDQAKARGTAEKTQPKRRSPIVRMVVDSCLALVTLAVMSTSQVLAAPHEFLGLSLLALMVAHTVLNRRWFAGLGKGRWTAMRVLQTIAVAGTVLCALGQAVSAIILSEHALAFLPELPGAWWARKVHMLCSFWFFTFTSAHVGLQWRSTLARMGAAGPNGLLSQPALLWICRGIWLVVAAFGVWSFVQLGIGPYLLGQVEFAYADYDTPVVLLALRYLSVGVLIAGACHYLAAGLQRIARH